MATKMFCDRCGEEINPKSSVTYASVQSTKYDIGDDYELCVSCAHKLKLWLNEKNGDKLKARYPYGFSPDRSLHRAENDV